MVSSPDTDALKASLRRLASQGVVPGVGARLEAAADDVAAELRAAVVAEVPAFTESGNPDLLPELRRHLEAHVGEVSALLGGRATVDFGFVAAYAERRAEQKFPLEALLRSCRSIHKLLFTRVRDLALDAADSSAEVRRVVAAAAEFGSEYMSAASTLLTARYVQQTRLVSAAEGDRRTALLNTLLDGFDESDAEAARLLRAAGYLEQRQSYCVVVARSVNPAEMQSRPRAQRMADALSRALLPANLRVVVGLRDNQVVAIISGTRRQSGWTAPQSSLAERIYDPLRTVGTAALIGLSNDVPSTSHIPRALREARFALEFASIAERVQPYSRIAFRQLLVRHGRDSVHAALPAWLDPFSRADDRARGALRRTLEAYADADMNVLKAAKALSLHPNTIYARMQKIDALTGRSPTNYHALTEMLLVLECAGRAQHPTPP